MTFKYMAHKLTRRTMALCFMLLALGVAGWPYAGLRTAVLAYAKPSGAAMIQPYDAPTIAKAFSPLTITIGGTSTVTLTLNNTIPLGVLAAFTDNLTGMVAVGGPAGGTCATLAGNTLSANATNLSFTGVVLPANGSCTVTFPVIGTVAGVQNNTTSGVTTDLTPNPGPPSNTATLTVMAPTISKSFDPATILLGEVSTVTLDLSNPSSVGVIASFTDNLTGMVAVGGPVGGTCATLAGNTLAANATNLSFNGVIIPAQNAGFAGTCWVTFQVKGTVAGTQYNTTSGITIAPSTIPGPPSNTATLNVKAVTIAKAFNPPNISSGGVSTVTLQLTNSTSPAVLASLTDTLVNMSAVGGATGGTCASLSGNSFAAGATNLSINGLVVPMEGSCTVTFDVTSTTAGTHVNTTSGVTINNSGVAGPVSNTATLTVGPYLQPTITSLNPSSATAGGEAFTLTVNGTNFVSGAIGAGSKVSWKRVGNPLGISLVTTLVSTTQLTAQVSAGLISTAGTVEITVNNNVMGSQPSAPFVFTINAGSAAAALEMATITVTDAGDGAANAANCPGANCRLRDAIAAAQPGDTVDFAVVGAITLTEGELGINKNLTLQGPGANALAISGNQASRVVSTTAGATVTLSGLGILYGQATPTNNVVGAKGGGLYVGNGSTVAITRCVFYGNNAQDGDGGGIFNGGGALTVTDTSLSVNTASGGSSATGGGIHNASGSLKIVNSTLVGNSASSNGSASGGGLFVKSGFVQALNSTFSGNLANGGTSAVGGGLDNTADGVVQLINSTFTGNLAMGSGATQGGGIHSTSTTKLINTIVAGNSVLGGTNPVGPDVRGLFSSQGSNLIGIINGVFFPTFSNPFDLVGTSANPLDPLLGPLAYNGGLTPTHALLSGSPAINYGNNCVLTNNCSGLTFKELLTTDQRGPGFPRQLNGTVDIGAYEY